MASAPPADDPRSEVSVLPTVARPSGGLPAWVMVLAAVGIGLVLFTVLDARRRSLNAPATPVRARGAASAEVTPLAIPPVVVPMPVAVVTPAPEPAVVPPPRIVQLPPPPVYQAPQEEVLDAPHADPPTRTPTEAALLIDNTVGNAGLRPSTDSDRPAAVPGLTGTRTTAGSLANRATTVPQGTLIPATLETSLDSTSPGLARAVVTSDIRGFDGSRVLIPRGSRLIGEYRADARAGQNRLLVNWIRLIRPDGVTMAIGSPTTDPMGQGGIKARVNSHFFARFSGAILQSALDVGVNLASRSANGVYVSPSSAMSALSPAQNGGDVQPTLKVSAAASISIFVARDLDFTGIQNR